MNIRPKTSPDLTTEAYMFYELESVIQDIKGGAVDAVDVETLQKVQAWLVSKEPYSKRRASFEQHAKRLR